MTFAPVSSKPMKANTVFIERMYFYRNEVVSCNDGCVSLCAEINSNTGTEFYVQSIKVGSLSIYICHYKNLVST